MSLYILPVYHSGTALAGFTAVLSLIGASGSFIWALFGAAFCKFFSRHTKLVNAVMALLLIYCAVSLFLWSFVRGPHEQISVKRKRCEKVKTERQNAVWQGHRTEGKECACFHWQRRTACASIKHNQLPFGHSQAPGSRRIFEKVTKYELQLENQQSEKENWHGILLWGAVQNI